MRLLLAMLWFMIAGAAGTAAWLTLRYGDLASDDERTQLREQFDPMLVVLVLALFVFILVLVAPRLARRYWPLPSNLDDVPGIARLIAAEDGGWTEHLTPALAGIMGGATVALVTTHPTTRLLAAGIAVAAVVTTLLVVRYNVARRRRAHETKDRIERVRGHGIRVVADVIEIEFGKERRYRRPKIMVTARFATPGGIRTLIDHVVTESVDAPTPGGTVLVWYVGDGVDTRDVYMEPDPDSIREPDAAERYRAPRED